MCPSRKCSWNCVSSSVILLPCNRRQVVLITLVTSEFWLLIARVICKSACVRFPLFNPLKTERDRKWGGPSRQRVSASFNHWSYPGLNSIQQPGCSWLKSVNSILMQYTHVDIHITTVYWFLLILQSDPTLCIKKPVFRLIRAITRSYGLLWPDDGSYEPKLVAKKRIFITKGWIWL